MCLNKFNILKYSDLLKREFKKINTHWFVRDCDVVNVKSNTNKTNSKIWKTYQNAITEIKDYCDDKGIITKSNSITKAKYLEVFAWEKMLAQKNLPKEFEFAKKMQELGYLDCYVFISMFQYDFYDQYKDFARNNRKRIKTYIETYLVE